MKNFIETLKLEFEQNSNHKTAIEQKAYMKNKFEFYGVKAPDRRKIQKPFFINEYLPRVH
jgi:3-methyladenine DNA glycosylase AlkD